MLSWLLEVEIGGRMFRWSVGEVTIATVAGDEVVYRPGLSDPGSIDEGSQSARLAVLDGRVDWPSIALFAQGGRATLRRALEGEPLERASVVVAGVVASVEWDTADAPVVLVIGPDSPLLVGLPLPDPFARCGAATWPVSPLSVKGDEGIAYPIIFGVPGWEGTGNAYPCVPIALAQWNGLVAGSHAIVSEDPDVPCTSVRVRNTATDEEADQNAVRITDKLGQTVLAADFLASVLAWPGSPTESRQLWAGFAPATGGGAARTAYEVIVYLLRRWGSGTVEWDRLAEVEGLLAGYLVDTWIDEVVPDPWQWIVTVLVPDLPVEVRIGASGRRYLVPQRWRLSATQVVAELVVGRQLERAGSITLDRPGPYNQFVADYRQDREGGYRARVVYTGQAGSGWKGIDPADGTIAGSAGAQWDPPRLTSSGLGIRFPATASGDPLVQPLATDTQAQVVVHSGRCADSVALYGPRPAPGVQTVDWTWDEGTVQRIIEDRIAREALPALLASYTVIDRARHTLREGDVVRLTDAERALDARLAVVDRPVSLGSDSTRITLRIPR